MAHFAQIDQNNIVTQVLVVPNEQEHRGEKYLASDLKLGGKWLQTSYNHRIRKQYAGIGYTYDPVADVFVAPKPFLSWTLDENHDWQPPVSEPNDEIIYFWNEEKLNWEPVKFN
jgi:hypothetical protein